MEKYVTFTFDYHRRNTEDEIHEINRFMAKIIDCTFTYVIAPKKDAPNPIHAHGYFLAPSQRKISELKATAQLYLYGFSFDVKNAFYLEGWKDYMRGHSPIFHTTDDVIIKRKRNLRKLQD